MGTMRRGNIRGLWAAALLTAVLMMSLSGCAKETMGESVSAADAYWIMIDQIYQQDEGLNENIRYLAINTETMVNLAEGDKQRLISELEKYGHEVLDLTFDQLKAEGFITTDGFKDGIFIQIQDEPMQDGLIKMDVSKWVSPKGAIGYNGCLIEYIDGMWQIKEMGDQWIS